MDGQTENQKSWMDKQKIKKIMDGQTENKKSWMEKQKMKNHGWTLDKQKIKKSWMEKQKKTVAKHVAHLLSIGDTIIKHSTCLSCY